MKNLYEEEKNWAAGMSETGGRLKKASKPGKYEQIITVSINEKLHGIELTFRYKPTATDRAAMKRDGWKYHYKKMLWYATNTPEHAATINKLHGMKKYPDGWNIPARDDQAQEVEEFKKSHAAEILAEITKTFPRLYEFNKKDQAEIVDEVVEIMMENQAAA